MVVISKLLGIQQGGGNAHANKTTDELSVELSAVALNVPGDFAVKKGADSYIKVAADGSISLGVEGSANTLHILSEGLSTMEGALTVKGDLTVNGTTTTVDSVNLLVKDRFIQSNWTPAADNAPLPSAITGFSVVRGATGDAWRDAASLIWNETASEWQFAWNTGADQETEGAYQSLKVLDLAATGNINLTGYLDQQPLAADPAPASGHGATYLKSVDGMPELFYQAASGDAIQLTANGALNVSEISIPLQTAYDKGNTIALADELAVAISAAAAAAASRSGLTLDGHFGGVDMGAGAPLGAALKINVSEVDAASADGIGAYITGGAGAFIGLMVDGSYGHAAMDVSGGDISLSGGKLSFYSDPASDGTVISGGAVQVNVNAGSAAAPDFKVEGYSKFNQTNGSAGSAAFDVAGFAQFHDGVQIEADLTAKKRLVLDSVNLTSSYNDPNLSVAGYSKFTQIGGSDNSAAFEVAGYAQFKDELKADDVVTFSMTGGNSTSPNLSVAGYAKLQSELMVQKKLIVTTDNLTPAYADSSVQMAGFVKLSETGGAHDAAAFEVAGYAQLKSTVDFSATDAASYAAPDFKVAGISVFSSDVKVTGEFRVENDLGVTMQVTDESISLSTLTSGDISLDSAGLIKLAAPAIATNHTASADGAIASELALTVTGAGAFVPAIASASNALALGVSVASIANGTSSKGKVSEFGKVSIAVESGLTIAPGEFLYLSASEAGKVTNVIPAAEGTTVYLMGAALAASSAGKVSMAQHRQFMYNN